MITGAVLAGGTSSRFGSEKAVATFGGSPMITQIISVLKEVTDDVLVAVAPGRGSCYRDVVGADVRVAEDRKSGQGPIRGLVTALEASTGDFVIVSPCDTPLLRKEVCETVIRKGMGRDGAVPCIRGYLEPLHAIYRREPCLEAFIGVIEKGGRRPKDAYGALDLVTIDEEELRGVDPDLESFINVNSEEGLALANSKLAPR